MLCDLLFAVIDIYYIYKTISQREESESVKMTDLERKVEKALERIENLEQCRRDLYSAKDQESEDWYQAREKIENELDAARKEYHSLELEQTKKSPVEILEELRANASKNIFDDTDSAAFILEATIDNIRDVTFKRVLEVKQLKHYIRDMEYTDDKEPIAAIKATVKKLQEMENEIQDNLRRIRAEQIELLKVVKDLEICQAYTAAISEIREEEEN